MTGMAQNTKATTYDPHAERKNADRAIAHANTAAYSLLAAIAEQLRPAHGANWADVGDAHRTVADLLNVYAAMSGRDSGDEFELPTDEGRGQPMRFKLENF